MIKIRAMQITDIESIVKIEEQISNDPWSQNLFIDCMNAGYYCYTMEAQGEAQAETQGLEIIGYGLISQAAGESHIINLAIAEEWQGQGCGKMMLEHLIDIASNEAQANLIYLEVRASNTVAIELYNKYKFTKIGIRENYYPQPDGDKEDAIVMMKSLI